MTLLSHFSAGLDAQRGSLFESQTYAVERIKLRHSSLTFPSPFQETANEVGPVGPSGDFEIPEDRRNGLGVVPMDPDLMGNTVDGGSSAAQLPQKNILERKEVLIGEGKFVSDFCF